MTPPRFPALAFAVLFALSLVLHAQMAGTSDATFNPILSDGDNDVVLATAMQPDGKLVIGGHLSAVGNETHNNIARINADGSVDSSFTASANGDVYSVALQADGKILIGGYFTSVNGSTRNGIARLNADGSLEGTATFNPGAGANNAVHCVTVQPDGKILIGGRFTSFNGSVRNNLARLNADGSLESLASFNIGAGGNLVVNCVVVQTDGQILIVGDFITFGNSQRNRIARLNPDGSLESTATFNLGSGPSAGAGDEIFCVALQADGKILAGGRFPDWSGAAPRYIARLNANGSVDGTFNVTVGGDVFRRIFSMAVQADGKILVVGNFNTINGSPRAGIARLFSDGSMESTSTFDPTYIPTGDVTVQADGKIVLGGYYGAMERLHNDAATQSLTAPSAARVQWLRGGTSPEVTQVTFELSSNGGSTWSALGAGSRLAGGWQLTGLSLPASGSLRARGQARGGYFNSSSWLVETVAAFGNVTPIQQWKLTHLGDANAPDLGDPDRDGLRTLAEYGLGLLPETPSPPPGASVFTYADGRRLRMFVPRDPAHSDITVSVEAIGDIVAGPWTPLATSTLGTPFTGPGYVGGDDATPGVKTVEVRDLVNLSATTQRWLRVKVTH